jgi:predicted transglutaminase-like cysteine proteinase
LPVFSFLKKGNKAMRQIAKVLLVAMAAAVCGTSVSEAAFFGLPRVLTIQLAQIQLDNPVLPPIGHSRFCLRYPADCQVHGIDFRRRNITLTDERWNELNTVNREVNRDIIPEVTFGNGATEEWVISPPAGDCKDYAITKRHELLMRGWPSRALLLSEVVVPSGEHHLILVVRVKGVDMVLDNLNENIRQAATTFHQYQWVRMESQQNPKYWMAVRTPNTMRVAMASD